MLKSRPKDVQVWMHWQNLKTIESRIYLIKYWKLLKRPHWGTIHFSSWGPWGERQCRQRKQYSIFTFPEKILLQIFSHIGDTIFTLHRGWGKRARKRIRIVYNRTRRVFYFFSSSFLLSGIQSCTLYNKTRRVFYFCFLFIYFFIRNSKLYLVKSMWKITELFVV